MGDCPVGITTQPSKPLITQKHLDLARKAGACLEGLKYAVGSPIAEISTSHAIWVENTLPKLARTVAVDLGMPLWVVGLTGSGDGSGSGYGSGYGSGDGSGFGSGSGDGAGDGSGAG